MNPRFDFVQQLDAALASAFESRPQARACGGAGSWARRPARSDRGFLCKLPPRQLRCAGSQTVIAPGEDNLCRRNPS